MNSIESFKNSDGQVWLNVASSVYVLNKFVNLDNNIFLKYIKLFSLIKAILPQKYHKTIETYQAAKQNTTLLQHNCIKPLKLPNESVDHILCSHFLEHVYPAEMENIIHDFYRVLKPGSTAHIIVPDLKKITEDYLSRKRNGDINAADKFIEETLLSRKSRGSIKYRLLEFTGGFGLDHYWMYDHDSMQSKLESAGFDILDKNTTPSKDYRKDDDSVHIVAYKK